VYGLSAASLVYSIARLCSSGDTSACTTCQASNFNSLSLKTPWEAKRGEHLVETTGSLVPDSKETLRSSDSWIDTQKTDHEQLSLLKSTRTSGENYLTHIPFYLDNRGSEPWSGFSDDSNARSGKFELGWKSWNGCDEDAYSFAASFSELFTSDDSSRSKRSSIRSAVNLHNYAVGRKVGLQCTLSYL